MQCVILDWILFSIKDIIGTAGDTKIGSTISVAHQCYFPDLDGYGTQETSFLVGNSYPSVQDPGTSFQELTLKWFRVKKNIISIVHATFLSLIQNKK